MRTILITGAAGFIGFHVAKQLLDNNDKVIGLDNLNDYYDVELKKSRLKILQEYKNFYFCKYDITSREHVKKVFKDYDIEYVIHLAAQAGVRYSFEDPYSYANTNVLGTVTLLEQCCKRKKKIKHFLYASSSSVYGSNTEMPLSTNQKTDSPVSLYAATKKATELIAHSYSHLYNVPCTGMRFFTVYGPYGRPDMSLFLFTKNIMEDKPIDVFNNGDMERDFTYVDDVATSINKLIEVIPNKFKVYNIGYGKPVKLNEFIETIETTLEKKAIKNLLPMQPGDVKKTFADNKELVKIIDFKPQVPVKEGVKNFVEWYKEYHERIIKNEPPLISIAMTCYNQQKYVRDALKSIAEQKYKKWELVIVDDCSTDKSVKIIKKHIKEFGLKGKVRITRHKENKGYGYSLGEAISNCVGELVVILDSDDALASNKVLKIVMKSHKKYPEASMTYSNFIECDSGLNPVKIQKRKQISDKESFLTHKTKISHLKVLKKSYYDKTDGINPELKQTVDKDLILRLEEVGKLIHINENLLKYRKHKGALTKSIGRKPKNYRKQVSVMRQKIYEDAKKRRGIK